MAKTILIVDDEGVVVDIAKRRLTQEGYLVLGVHDGEVALKVMREGILDLIVLDVEMPKMNGYTFMAERKKIPGADKVPVIVLTAHHKLEPIFQRHGIETYLTKPLQFNDLLVKIKEVIGEPDKVYDSPQS